MKFIGERITRFDRLDSTSNYVAKQVDLGLYAEGTVILSHFQTEGRGQRGSIWQSEAGENLTFSFAVDVEFLPLHQQFLIAKAVSLGIHDFLRHHLELSVAIKWPNDVLVGHQKIAGMLIELKGTNPKMAVIGIGLNINQRQFSSSVKATSLALEKNASINLSEALDELLEALNHRWYQLTNGHLDLIRKEYCEKLFGYKSWVAFRETGRSFQGLIQDVDDQGVMVVRSRQGGSNAYHVKEVQIIYGPAR